MAGLPGMDAPARVEWRHISTEENMAPLAWIGSAAGKLRLVVRRRCHAESHPAREQEIEVTITGRYLLHGKIGRRSRAA
jgi:hypothetical protein